MDATDAFGTAVREGRTDDVRGLLDANPGLAEEALDGLSPVLVALFAGAEDTAVLLAERRTSLDACEAAALGLVDALRRLDEAGRDGRGGRAEGLGAPGAFGWTPLHLAAYLGRREATAWLLGRGVDPGIRSDNAEANTPLHAALAGRNDPEVVRLLLEGGADPDAGAALGVTPLHLAASRGNGDAVDALLARGALPASMEDGRMPSALADERGHPALASRLAELEGASADPPWEAPGGVPPDSA
ncbi:MAG TPA: ankyrin repeat domain-containing protein [Longimicrobiales bacterium]|nr:ankyrin repeat domain-containing protein [Longimicrobiales bacterium]